jgi:hypothetical protein
MDTRTRGRTAFLSSIVVALLLGTGGVLVLSGRSPVPGMAGDEVPIGGGVVVIHALAPEQLAHTPEMPASMMRDHLPPGRQRLVLQFDLRATSDTGLVYGPDLVHVAAAEGPVEATRHQLPSGRLASGERIDLTLVLEAPDPVDELLVTVGQGTVRVRPGPRGAPHGHG